MTRRPRNSAKVSQDWSSARASERYSSLRDLSVTYEGFSDIIATRLPDISTRGMFINTTRHFPEGAVLNVRFRLARTGVEVQSRCEVRYCLDGVGVGVEFLNISSKATQAIEEELHPAGRSRNVNGDRAYLRSATQRKKTRSLHKKKIYPRKKTPR
jgi:hypothetical protein